MTTKWISGDRPEETPRKSSRNRRIRETDLLLRQLNGGEPGDFLAEAERLEPYAPKPYRDDDLTIAGFEPAKFYNYTDTNGKLLYEVVRYQHKTVKGIKKFRQRRPGSGDGVLWIADAGLVKVPYRWPDLIARPEDQVFVCEGEKDTDRLSDLGLLATTVAGQNWSETAADALSGRDILIMEDNDAKGRENAQKSVEVLEGRAKSIRVVRLPKLKYKQDCLTGWTLATIRMSCSHTRNAQGIPVPARSRTNFLMRRTCRSGSSCMEKSCCGARRLRR